MVKRHEATSERSIWPSMSSLFPVSSQLMVVCVPSVFVNVTEGLSLKGDSGKSAAPASSFRRRMRAQFGLHVRRSDFPHLRIPGDGRAESREHERAEHAEDDQRADDFQQRETPLGGAGIRTHGKAPRTALDGDQQVVRAGWAAVRMPQFPFILGFQKSFEAFIRDEVAGSLLLHGFRVEVGDAFFQSAGGLRQIFDLPGAFGASAQGRGNELRRHEAHDRHEDDGDR